jgi:hypothetical protein
MFEEAALRRFVELDRAATVLARNVEIAYRKPCFAGQRMRVIQQAFEHAGRLGTTAVLVPDSAAGGAEGAPQRGPHTFMRMTFEP